MYDHSLGSHTHQYPHVHGCHHNNIILYYNNKVYSQSADYYQRELLKLHNQDKQKTQTKEWSAGGGEEQHTMMGEVRQSALQ